MKPSIFIGSSVEALPVSYAMQQELEHSFEPTVWSQGIFNLTKSTLQSLFEALDNFEFAVFVFQPDDLTILRETEKATIRDNVLFEFGLFLGRLGPNNTFFVVPRGDRGLHIPTDLLGINPATYDAERSDGNLRAAIGPACHEIRSSIKDTFPHEIRELLNNITPRMKNMYIEAISSAHDYDGSPTIEELKSMDLRILDSVHTLIKKPKLKIKHPLGYFSLMAAEFSDNSNPYQIKHQVEELKIYERALTTNGF